jgi:NAD(P)-dependent dehydrogenase (short-subunit alcohol dehydrogenase family)
MLLQGQKAIVTGASSGIGMATAERLGREGASVCVDYYSENERSAAEQVVAAIEQGGSKALAIQADVTNEEDVRRMVAQAGRELGGLDLLVNNAGIENQVPLLEMPLADWNAVIDTNLTGTFLCLREAGKLMAAGGGRRDLEHLERSRVHSLARFRTLLREQRRDEAADGDGGARACRQLHTRPEYRAWGDRDPDQQVRPRRSRGQARGRRGDPARPDGQTGRDRGRGGMAGQQRGVLRNRHNAGR